MSKVELNIRRCAEFSISWKSLVKSRIDQRGNALGNSWCVMKSVLAFQSIRVHALKRWLNRHVPFEHYQKYSRLDLQILQHQEKVLCNLCENLRTPRVLFSASKSSPSMHQFGSAILAIAQIGFNAKCDIADSPKSRRRSRTRRGHRWRERVGAKEQFNVQKFSLT